MTSDIDVIKTNEFLRLRKLRLQQVREQSKDIAKKIRQRAKIEKLRHEVEVDSKKEKEYIECQEKLVKRLEHLYAKSLQNVGSGHNNALEATHQDIEEKIDLSKSRGREAVAELRKKKQNKLDEQKKILDRKLQAREVANEISREKSNTTKNLLTKSSKTSDQDKPVNDSENNQAHTIPVQDNIDNPDAASNDMGTQWECADLPNEWEHVPALSLPKDDSVKDLVNDKFEKSKRFDLFALSDEMPSSLRGGLTSVTEGAAPLKPSLTLVSDYLQNRNLRLREPEPSSSKKSTEDLRSIRQTILRTRATKTNGRVLDTVCHVLDEQVIPVPSWQAGDNFVLKSSKHGPPCLKSSKTPNINLPTSPRSLYRQLQPNPHCLDSSKKVTCCQRMFKPSVSGAKDKSAQSTEPEISLQRKKSISVYNHNTRDLHDIPCNDDGMVIRDNRTDEDAYTQAYKETTLINNMDKEQLHKRQRDMRNRVAVTRQNVDKEYQDTLAFLNSLPKDTGARVIKTAYMDDDQQNLQKDRHQRKMQQEFKKIEKECYKHSCKHSKRKATIPNHRSNSKSPVNGNVRKDFEYSWMPVPESDGSLAIHTIPTKNKPSNTVKFSQDSYHEYRSRHKHTPPTKDIEKKRVLETVIVQNNSSNESSVASETSSIEDLSLERTKDDSKLKDAERIIIYKILESKKDKKKHKKLQGKSKSIDEDIRLTKKDDNQKQKVQSIENTAVNVQTGVSFEELQEGVYKAVSRNGQSFNITSCYTANVEMWQSTTERRPWWDNITSMYYTEDQTEGDVANRSRQTNKTDHSCCTNKSHISLPGKDIHKDGVENKNGTDTRRSCKCEHNLSKDSGLVQPSAATSTSSFKTASNDKGNRYVPESGFLKFIDEGGQETGKFYIGASGFIKDDDYEVVIQLRKKEGERVKNISGSINKEIKETLNNASKTTLSENTEPNKVMEHEKKMDVSINFVEDKSDSPVKKQQESNQQKELQKNQKETEGTSPMINMVPSTCEKAVHTSFQDTDAIPDNVPKCDPVSRPATSAYTQTSFNSSMPRPVFMQMSSSTSTAYMSPPDFVLPKFLRQDHVFSYEDTYDSENTMNKQQYMTKQNRCKNEQCTCTRCECYNGEVLKIGFRKRNKIETPPNTARSTHKCDSTSEISYKECKKPKCRKCVSRKNSSSKHSVCYKSHRNKSIQSLRRKSTKNNLLHADQMSSTTQTPQQKLFNLNKNNKFTNVKLNPTVKKYVNQLLSLNREGHKAIEIINQNCSNVTTPGSSIVNVTCNEAKDSTLENKISLEDIKNILKQRILKDISNNKVTNTRQVKNTESQTEKILKLPKKKSVHKVKSLNISKRLQKRNKFISNERLQMKTSVSSSSSSRQLPLEKAVKTRSKSSPTPRPVGNSENNTSSDVCDTTGPSKRKSFKHTIINRQSNSQSSASMAPNFRFQQRNQFSVPLHRATTTSMSSDSGLTSFLLKNMNQSKLPTNTCTQTNEIIDAETNFMKLAENKIQNMEKIADLTEKCTKRLSNLAKVLEEVRRNKSSVYSQITSSDSASESDNRSGKHKTGPITICSSDTNILVESKTKRTSSNSPIISTKLDDKEMGDTNSIQFPSFLKDIPKPDFFKSASITSLSVTSEKSDQYAQIAHTPTEQVPIKYRGRPPPALTRINLKNGQDVLLTPHELSTVVEVDSPMSVKNKNQSSHEQLELPHKLNEIVNLPQENLNITPDFRLMRENPINPDLLQSNLNLSKRHSKITSTDSSDDSKMRMMDMKQFNDIMLKPFISLQEYAKQCNIGLDDGSNTEDFSRDDPRNDESSSLHSDGSLPDVIAELLKRNIISEPFKFDSASNINSTTLSSESTISVLALSKVRKEKKKGMFVKNKENIVETSETLSISSNPDLEKAFQKLGMGWASSTLKKTKERLALSSSSSASSSSMAQFKIRSFSQNVPTLGTDSTSSLIDTSIKHDRKKSSPSKYPIEYAKNAIQQTSLTNSMTVKEFLTNELANKITFNNKSTRKEAEEQFVSLYETKMPEDMKNTPDREEDEYSVASPNNNRARTSTPVQIFKSTTYRSTSSSNTSNGLFSNADDLSSVKGTSNSVRNHSTSDKDDLTIPNCSLKTKKELSDRSKSD